MKLQGRDLKSRMIGDDVALLHRELTQLGFAISAAERKRKIFGKDTLAAVREFQKRQNLPVTGIVNETTAAAFGPTPLVLPLKPLILKPVIMKMTGQPLSSGMKNKDVEVLHQGLRQLGFTLDVKESKIGRFGTTTHAAVTSFQKIHHLASTGTVDKPTVALMNAGTTFRTEGNTLAMRETLRAAVDSTSDAPELAYWLARYEILAGNYVAAHDAVGRAPDFPLMEDLPPFADLRFLKHPEAGHPENFYTYRHAQVDTEKIRDLKISVKEKLEDATSSGRKQLEPADLILDCHFYWNQGNADLVRGRFRGAEVNYEKFYESALNYFSTAYEKFPSDIKKENQELHRKLQWLRLFFSLGGQGVFVQELGLPLPDPQGILNHFAKRRQALSLDELFQKDWNQPTVSVPNFLDARDFPVYQEFSTLLQSLKLLLSDKQENLEAPLLALAFIFVPLALVEVKRLQGQYRSALEQIDNILLYHGLVGGEELLNEFIELPYLRILKGKILLEKADREYKARIPSDTQPPAGPNSVLQLKAADTYQNVLDLFAADGEYVSRVEAGAELLKATVTEVLNRPLLPPLGFEGTPSTADEISTQRHEFHILGKTMPIETIEAASDSLPGLDKRFGPHESLTKFVPPNGGPVLKETNPLIYAMVTEAKAHLLQIEAGFNYLGYRDDYVPPWRFQFLLDRARYFSEHAKNAQRDYLNFLSNAEREEFQELSLAQSVELEKSNVRIETARVDQTRLEVEVSKLSQELAELVEANAQARFDAYADFAKYSDNLLNVRIEGYSVEKVNENLRKHGGAIIGAIGGPLGVGLGALDDHFGWSEGKIGEAGDIAGTFFGDRFGGGAVSSAKQNKIASMQRELEKNNLERSISEAAQSANIAAGQLDVANAALTVAGMQRTAALLRHEFAVQNFAFLQGRVLNAEMWYKLADFIRSVSETYMRYAVELAFLAEQAYEFEADKRINVIRFDYDVSEEASLLAADFLLRDLDTLEQDLIVTQQKRQQQVRYVLSLAREFPEALQELRDNGSMIFSLRLEQIERRFPGLLNARIGSVEVTPVALMDSTRFSMELTHLGTSQIRLKAHPDTILDVPGSSPLISEGSWLADFHNVWPVKIRVTGYETKIFSSLTSQERGGIFPFISNNQRNGFEGLGAASAWRVDMSMKENQVVPGTLADLFVTFNLSGYHDPGLRKVVESARRETTVLTKFLSARQGFADAFYDLHHSGRMTWNITGDMLSLHAPVRGLRNLGVMLLPAPRRIQFSQLMSTYVVEVEVAADGEFEVLTPIPEIAFSLDHMVVTTSVTGTNGSDVSWNFGDGGGFTATNQHTYTRTGTYEVILRLVKDGRLHEYTAKIFVSRTHTLSAPLMVFPSFNAPPVGQKGVLANVSIPPNENLFVSWQVAQIPRQQTPETLLELPPGKHVVIFMAIRTLQGRIYSQQRFVPHQLVPFNGLSISTNRVFNLDGSETTGIAPNDPPNLFTEHVFPKKPGSDQRVSLSALDNWTLDLTFEDNPFLRSVTTNDTVEMALDDIGDAVLILEYETGIS